MTDLGTGNQSVADTFALYKDKGAAGCKAAGSGRRILITGFGLFQGADYNISGIVAQAMGDTMFVPNDMKTNVDYAYYWQRYPATVPSGKLATGDNGATVMNRALTINGTQYELCIVTLDVLWDLAAAIIVHEMDQFQPERVIMLGRGKEQAIFEGGAFNRAISMSGYESSGAPALSNVPVDDNKRDAIQAQILPGGDEKLPMTWDNQKLYTRTKRLFDGMRVGVQRATGPREENTYICNNASYVVLAAAAGKSLQLAGGKVELKMAARQVAPQIGFFHIPSSTANDYNSVRRWTRVLANIIDASY